MDGILAVYALPFAARKALRKSICISIESARRPRIRSCETHLGAQLHMAEAHKVGEVHFRKVDGDGAVDLLALREALPSVPENVEVIRHLAKANVTEGGTL